MRGTSFRVDETPALQFDCAKQSLVLVSFNSREPFSDWNDEMPARRQSSWRAGIRLGRAIGMVGEIDYAGQAEARGLVVLMPPMTGSLAVLGEEPPRSWWSEPRPGRQRWSTRVEPEFSSAGALAAARLFVAQTGDDRPPASSAAQPPHMKVVPWSSGS